MDYTLNLGSWSSIFAVPTALVDNYIKTASAENIKILLYLLRNTEQELSTTVISAALGISEETVDDGIVFWCQRNILSLSNNKLKPSETAQNLDVKGRYADEKSDRINKINTLRSPQFMPKEIAQTVKSSKEADYLFKRCEELFGRTLKHNEQNTLTIILEDICLPVSVALLLVEYCFSIGKATPSNLREMALDWSERQITTIEAAENHLFELKSYNKDEKRFKKMFGISSAFSKKQREFINTWITTYGFSDEMINEAFEATLNGAGKLSFPYMNKVLENWFEKGIKSPEAIIEKKQNQQENKESSFDISEIEKYLASKYDK